MRYLIAGDDAAVCNLERQRRFFHASCSPGARSCATPCERIRAQLYAALAAFTRAFLQVETQGFDLLEQ